MKRILSTVVILLSLCFAARAEVSAEISKMKGNPFKGVTFIEGLNEDGNALHIKGDRLYYGARRMLYVFDITVPSKPALLGSVKMEGLCRQITSKDGMVYVASRETGLWVVDARNPAEMKVAARFDPVELPTGIDVCGNVLFLAERINGVEFVDITDPLQPRHIFLQKTPECQSVFYRDGILYSGDWGSHEVTVISAADMSDIKILDVQPLWGNGDGVFAQGKYLYTASGHHSRVQGLSVEENFGMGHSMQVFEISDPVHPKLVSTIKFPKMYGQGNDYWSARPTANGKMVFVSDTFNGLHAVDTRNPAKPVQVGSIIFKGSDGKVIPMSAVEPGKGVVYAAVYGGGLAVVDCPAATPSVVVKGKAPVNVSYRHEYKCPSDTRFHCWKPSSQYPVRSVAAQGDYLYAACSDDGLAILKMSPDGSVRQVGKGPQAFASDVKIRGNRLYSAEGVHGLAIYEIQADASLKEVDRVQDIGNGSRYCYWVEVPDDSSIIASPRGQYYWIDGKNPNGKDATMFLSSSAGWDRYVPNHVMRGGIFAHGRPHFGMQWIDLNGDHPRLLNRAKPITINQRSGVSNYKNGTAIVLIKEKLYIVEPCAEDLPAGVPMKLNGAPMWDGGNKLAVTDRMGHSIVLLDVTDDAAPKILWREKTEAQPEMPIFHRGRLIVPCAFQGLLIQK